MSGILRNAFLVVVALIAAATFQAILTPRNSTNNKKLRRLEVIEWIYNYIAFCIAMGTSVILMLDQLQNFYIGLLALFYGSLAAFEYVITGECYTLLGASLVSLPILMILPWKIIIMKGKIRGDIYHEYNLDEVKYLVFGSTFRKQGPIVTWMAERKASR